MDAPSPELPRGAALNGLLLLAVLYTLTIAAAIVLPILVATLLALVLTPVVVRLKRLGIPRGLAAGMVTIVVVAGIGWGVQVLAAPAADWIERAPQSIGEIERKLRPVKKPVEKVIEATEQVEKLAGNAEDNRTVKVKSFDLREVFVVSLTTLAGQALVVVVLLFFLLATGDKLLLNAARVPRTVAARRRVIAIARGIKQDVAVYLGMITLVNIGLGIVTALVMWALDMPNPALWGAVGAILNYVPYAGAMVNTVVLLLVGLLSFDELWRGLLPAGAFLVLTTLESDVVTPWAVGTRLTVPPLIVFLSLVVWGWMWGVAGALLAVPILVIFKVTTDHVPALAPLGAFLDGFGGTRMTAGKGKRIR